MRSLSTITARQLTVVCGSALEWYDFALYGCFASFIAQHFFPSLDKNAGLLSTFAIFAIGFLARPLGAIVFGHYGDRIGRRLPLLISLYGISLPTLAIGLLPTYATIGFWAPCLLLVARLIQGFMIGGEYTGSLLFIAEDSEPRHRAKHGALAMMSALGGMVFGTLVAAALTHWLPATVVTAWAWRLPFWLAFILSAIGYYFRRLLVESAVFTRLVQTRRIETSPLKTTFRQHSPTVLLAIGICALTGTTEYLLFAFLPSFIQQHSHFALTTILQINTLGMIFMLVLLRPLASWSDRVGRRPLLLFAAVGYFVLSIPIFYLLTQANLLLISAGLVLFNALLALACAPMAALYLELFPTEVRYTGIAVSYNLSFALFAGTAPMLATLCLRLSPNPIAPAFLVMSAALLSGLCFYFMPETFQRNLE